MLRWQPRGERGPEVGLLARRPATGRAGRDLPSVESGCLLGSLIALCRRRWRAARAGRVGFVRRRAGLALRVCAVGVTSNPCAVFGGRLATSDAQLSVARTARYR